MNSNENQQRRDELNATLDAVKEQNNQTRLEDLIDASTGVYEPNNNNKQNMTQLKNKPIKQTAVEWLVEELFKKIDYIQVDPRIINQALAMEKEQIVSVYWDAYNEGKYSTDKTATEYYNETFKSE